MEANSIEEGRCYGCFRPVADCFCDAIPKIENQTEVLILQHMRERTHPFNTARIVRRALTNVRLVAGHNAELANTRWDLHPSAGLLYPAPNATLLSEVPVDRRPQQLVIIDGTWHHAKTMVRDITVLHKLPRYQIDSGVPGRYRIRREPNATALSTLEATVAALRTLEPETVGLDRLVDVFDTMVERQLAYSERITGPRSKRRRNRAGLNVPTCLLRSRENIVIAYGESSEGGRAARGPSQVPVYWVAERFGTEQRAAWAIQPAKALQSGFLSHLELSHDHFREALTIEQFRDAWTAFLRPSDTLVVYHESCLRLLRRVGANSSPALVLKSVNFRGRGKPGGLDNLLASEGLEQGRVFLPGRAGKRLANAVALVRHWNILGNE